MPTWSKDLIFLAENQYGFSNTSLGFPSISACRAIVYHTSRGLYGFHQASGAHDTKFERFGKKFAGFVDGQGGGTGLNLYVAAKVGAGSSYSLGDKGALEHLAEMKAFASALDFQGKIRSYDLSHKWPNVGVYVEITAAGEACTILANPWVEHHNPAHKASLAVERVAHHKLSYPPSADFIMPDQVFVQVDTTGQQRVEPIPIT